MLHLKYAFYTKQTTDEEMRKILFQYHPEQCSLMYSFLKLSSEHGIKTKKAANKPFETLTKVYEILFIKML